MDLIELKSRIESIKARRREIEETFPRRPDNPAWFLRFCSWCGVEFNQQESGLTCYCGEPCRAMAARVCSNVAQRENRAKQKAKKRKQKPAAVREMVKCLGCEERFRAKTGKVWCSQACKTRTLRKEGVIA